MALVVPDLGEIQMLEGVRYFFVNNGIHLKLYKNNYTPVDGSTLASFTEADFSGYAQDVPSFGAVTTIGNKAAMQDSMSRVFTHNGGGTGNTIYGYYVIWDTGPEICFAERFPAPISMAALGNTISILLHFTLNSENH